MKSLEELAGTERSFRAGEFACLVRHLGLARGSLSNAAALAAGRGAPKRVVEILQRAAVSAQGLSDSGLVGYSVLVSAFVDSLRWSSVFYRLLGDGAMVRLPFEVRVGGVISAAGAGIVEPGQAISVRNIDLETATLERQKAAAMMVMSRELLDAAGSTAEALITRSLRASVTAAVDAQFMSIVLDGVSPATATASPLDDLRALLAAAAFTDESRPAFVAAPDVSRRLATAGTERIGSPPSQGGQFLFPMVNPVGAGELLKIPQLTSSAVAAGTLVLLDASRIGAGEDGVEITASSQAAIQMDSAPTQSMGVGSPLTPVGSNAVSTWQTNAVALRALAYFGAAKISSGAAVALEGVTW